MGDTPESKGEEAFPSLLMAEYNYCAEAFRQSESLGEKRVTTFLAVATVLISVVGLIAGEKGNAQRLLGAAPLPLAVLLFFGRMTFLRVVKRNLDTDGYKVAMGLVRKYFAERIAGADRYLFFDPNWLPGPRRMRVWPFVGSGGWLETVALMNSLLAAVMAYVLLPQTYGPVVAVSVALIAWLGQTVEANWRYREGAVQPDQYFRAGVGAVIANHEGLVLSLERRDSPGSWQLPQGGLQIREEPAEAVLREVREETGIPPRALELVDSLREPIAYELDKDKRSAKTGRGQAQYWFVFRYKGSDTDVRIGEDGEFQAYRWTSFEELLRGVVKFRRPLYSRLNEFFAHRVKS